MLLFDLCCFFFLLLLLLAFGVGCTLVIVIVVVVAGWWLIIALAIGTVVFDLYCLCFYVCTYVCCNESKTYIRITIGMTERERESTIH